MISQTAEYALRALAWLALYGETRAPASELAEQVQAPFDYLAKVLQQLAAAGLVEGRRGVGGGYRLAKPPSAIRLLDAVNAVTPIRRIETCPLGLSRHGSNLCPLHRKMDEAAAAVIGVLDGVTLADLIDAPEGVSTPLCEERPTSLRVAAPKSAQSSP